MKSDESAIALLFVLLVVAFLLSILGCGGGGGGSGPRPKPPRHVGIHWQVGDPEVAYYRVYVDEGAGRVSTYEIPPDVGCWSGEGLSCWVTAVSEAGIESEPSETCDQLSQY